MRLRLVVLGVLPPLALAAGAVPPRVAVAADAPTGSPRDTPKPDQGAAGAAGAPVVGDSAVIRPPAGIDPGMTKTPPDAAPEAGRMPVVKPPGTAGGGPGVVPK